MDDKIRKIAKDVKQGKKATAERELKGLEKADKKRDKFVDKAKKMMKK